MTVRLRAVLIDLSGTLHIDDAIIPGAIEAVQRLRKNERIRLGFVTNTTKESSKFLLARCERLGLDVQPHELFTSMTAARRLIEREQLRPLLLLEDEALDDFDGVDTVDPNAVIVGLAPSEFHFERLNEAFRLLLKGNVKLIAIHKARYYKRTDGMALGPGPFVALLEHAADVQAQVVGKPDREFFLSALRTIDENLRPEEAVMIGDDVRDDINGAIGAGLRAVLVKTGKYRDGDERQFNRSDNGGALCMNSIVEAVDCIEEEIRSDSA